MEFSAYERARAEQMRQNQEVLESLGLGGGVLMRPKRVEAPKARRPKRAPAPARQPERKSARILGAQAADMFVEHESARGAVILGGKDDPSSVSSAHHARDPLADFADGVQPEGEDELLEGEVPAFEALREAKRAKAAELQTEGYRIAQHRSLCELVRRRVSTLEELRECWGFGGAGVRVDKYGAMFLDALRPHLDALRDVHAQAHADFARARESATDERAPGAAPLGSAPSGVAPSGGVLAAPSAARGSAAAEALQRVASTESARASLPTGPDELTPVERHVFDTLIAATHVRAEEIDERWVWNIATSRSLSEMVRRRPTTLEELSECWGFGGGGVRLRRHGDFLLDALAPHLGALRAGASGVADANERADKKRTREHADEHTDEHTVEPAARRASRRAVAAPATRSDRRARHSTPASTQLREAAPIAPELAPTKARRQTRSAARLA